MSTNIETGLAEQRLGKMITMIDRVRATLTVLIQQEVEDMVVVIAAATMMKNFSVIAIDPAAQPLRNLRLVKRQAQQLAYGKIRQSRFSHLTLIRREISVSRKEKLSQFSSVPKRQKIGGLVESVPGPVFSQGMHICPLFVYLHLLI
jgi:hypothetical protein